MNGDVMEEKHFHLVNQCYERKSSDSEKPGTRSINYIEQKSRENF